MSPKASFVIPAYNAQCWIAETIKSCQGQSVKDVEIVVVNDGSKDYTSDIVQGMAKLDKRIVLVDLEKNVGRSEARNIGNDRATADIICVLDSDDKAVRNRVRDTLECFRKKNPDLIYGGVITIDTFGNMSARFVPEPFSREASIKNKTHFICHSTVAYRKGLSRNVRYQPGVYSEEGFDDWRFIWDAHLKGYKFAYVKSPLCYYRTVDGTISSTRDQEKVAKVKAEFHASLKV